MGEQRLVERALATDPTIGQYFLGQLATLAVRQAASPSAKERAALSVAMFSLFLDCADLGVAEQAQRIMGSLRVPSEAGELVAA